MDQESINQLINAFRLDADKTEILGVWEVLLALSLSLVCAVVVALLYRKTHKTTGYSQSFTQTLVLISLVTTLIMIVIGSNIARAFSLVGALSIIRFRNAVKETRDVGYLFFAMAIAMAAGTRFYGAALLATAFISCVALALHVLEFGAAKGAAERLLRVHLPPDREVEELLGPTLEQLFSAWSVVRVETVQKGLYNQAVLSVVPKDETTPTQVLEAIRGVTDGLKVSYSLDEHRDDI